MDEDTWPEKYNKVPMMADWGRNFLYMHHVTPDGPSFKQKEEEFIKLPQITDVDVDGSGRLYLSAWDGAGYSGNPDKGYIVRVVPQGWSYMAFPEIKNASVAGVNRLFNPCSSSTRLYAFQELVARASDEAAAAALEAAQDKNLALSTRVTGIYTYAQIAKGKGVSALLDLGKEPA